jgi:DUF971 family protein
VTAVTSAVKPTRIEAVNAMLVIVWDDGHESYFDFEPLRRACPCATCQGERNILVEFKPPPPNYTPASFELTGWQFIGGYGFQPQWRDGHNTGIFSFDYLRQLENRP